MTNSKMDKKKLEHYKKLLVTLKQDLSQDISKMSAHGPGENEGDIEKNAGFVQHMADVATDMYDREFNLGLASNERELLYKIEGALERIQDKSYGVCTGCQKSIAIARLNALPYVETCLKCQEKLESGK